MYYGGATHSQDFPQVEIAASFQCHVDMEGSALDEVPKQLFTLILQVQVA